MRKILLSLIILNINLLFAFEWPIPDISNQWIFSYFGNNNGGIISTSLIFKDETSVVASEKGTILIKMQEQTEDTDFFPSTLGTTVIISHEDELLSVYGNLDSKSVSTHLQEKKIVEKKDIIGITGNSAWQKNKNSLEFQIIDTKKNSAINPKVLLPRMESELPLYVTNVIIKNKNNVSYELSKQKNFPSGFYRIYQLKSDLTNPYKTVLSLNGVIIDQINYDAINHENNKIYLSGKKKYTTSDIYPEKNLQLLGEVSFTPGKSTLGINIQDILGNTKQYNYNISIY